MKQKLRTYDTEQTLTKLLNGNILRIYDYQDNYFVSLDNHSPYNEVLWIVNKEGKKLRKTSFLELAVSVDDIWKLPTITPEEFRSRMKEN